MLLNFVDDDTARHETDDGKFQIDHPKPFVPDGNEAFAFIAKQMPSLFFRPRYYQLSLFLDPQTYLIQASGCTLNVSRYAHFLIMIFPATLTRWVSCVFTNFCNSRLLGYFRFSFPATSFTNNILETAVKLGFHLFTEPF